MKRIILCSRAEQAVADKASILGDNSIHRCILVVKGEEKASIFIDVY